MNDSKEHEESKATHSDSETNETTKPSDEKELQARAQDATQISLHLSCAHCGKAIPGDKRFCVYCGAPTGVDTDSITCPACGDAMPVGTLFCGSCGMSLRASSPVSFSGTGTLSFGVPTRTMQPEKQSRAWFGVGAAVTVLLLVGLGIVIGTQLFRDSEQQIVSVPPPLPLPLPPPEPPKLSPPEEKLGGGASTLSEDPGREPKPPSPEVSPRPPSPAERDSSKTLTPSLDPPKPPSELLRPATPPPDLLPGRHKIIAKKTVPIHDGPNTTAKKIGERNPGQTVNVTKVSGQWVEIRAKTGIVGYIPRDVVAVELVPEDKKPNAVLEPRE